MKSVDLQNIVKSKHQSGDGVTKIFKDLSGELSLSTIKRWFKMINETGSIKLRNSPWLPTHCTHKRYDPKGKATIKLKKKIVDQKVGKRIMYI